MELASSIKVGCSATALDTLEGSGSSLLQSSIQRPHISAFTRLEAERAIISVLSCSHAIIMMIIMLSCYHISAFTRVHTPHISLQKAS